MSSLVFAGVLALAGAAVPPWPGLTAGNVNIIPIEDDDPTIRLTIAIFSGSASDPVGREGLAALTARLVTGDASDAVPPGGALDRLVGRDMTLIRLRAAPERFDTPYRRLVEGLIDPIAPDASLPSFPAANEHDLLSIAGEAFDRAIHPGHPYAHPVDDPAARTNANADDVRAFHERHYRKGNISITVSGSTVPLLVQRLSRDLAALPDGVTEHVLAPATYLERPRFYLIENAAAADRTRIVVGHPLDVPEAHPDNAPVTIALAYLASEGAALLDTPLPRLRGRIAVTIETDTESAAERTLGILARFERLLSTPLPPTTLDALKTTVMGSREIPNGDHDPVPAPSRAVFERLIGQGERFDAAVGRVTPDDVRAAAGRHIHPARLAIVAVTGDPVALARSLVVAGVDSDDISRIDRAPDSSE